MTQGTLWYLTIVKLEIMSKRGRKLIGRAKMVAFEQLGNASVEALDHAIGLWVTRWNQAVLRADRGACLVK